MQIELMHGWKEIISEEKSFILQKFSEKLVKGSYFSKQNTYHNLHSVLYATLKGQSC